MADAVIVHFRRQFIFPLKASKGLSSMYAYRPLGFSFDFFLGVIIGRDFWAPRVKEPQEKSGASPVVVL